MNTLYYTFPLPIFSIPVFFSPPSTTHLDRQEHFDCEQMRLSTPAVIAMATYSLPTQTGRHVHLLS